MSFIATAANQMFGSIASAYAQAKDLNTQAQNEEINAKFYDEDASNALYAGNKQEDAIRSKGAAIQSGARAKTAENGMAMSPTAIAALGQGESNIEQDALNARYASQMSALDFKNRAVVARTNAANMREAAKKATDGNAWLRGFITGGNSVIGSYTAQGGRFGGGGSNQTQTGNSAAYGANYGAQMGLGAGTSALSSGGYGSYTSGNLTSSSIGYSGGYGGDAASGLTL